MKLKVDDERAAEIAGIVAERICWLASTGTERNATSLLSGATRFRDIQERLADATPDLLSDRATMAGEIEVLERALENQAEGLPGTQRGWAAKWKEQALKELAKAGEEKQC